IGTGGFRNLQAMADAVEESGAEMATLALRRVDPSSRGSIVEVLENAGCFLLPNTAGCFTARDAIATAQLAREAFETDWVKLEVIGDDKTLLPDPLSCSPRRNSSWPTASPSSPTRTTTRSSPAASRTRAARP